MDKSRFLLEYRQRKHDTFRAFVLGSWLVGVFLIRIVNESVFVGQGIAALSLNVFAILWPIVYFAFSRGKSVPGKPAIGVSIAILIFSVTAALSCFVSPSPVISAAYLGMTLLCVLVILQFKTNLTKESVQLGLKLYALLAAGSLLIFAAYDYTPGLRLGKGADILSPNAISLVAFSVVMAAMLFSSYAVRYVVVTIAAMVIILAQSRAAAVATIVGVIVIVLLRLGAIKTWKRLVLVGIGSFVLVTLMIVFEEAITYQIESFFKIHDRHRGIESGGSGRLLAWLASWELFLDHPTIGVGFRAHEEVLGVASSAHNGYLATLAEIGIIGFSAVMYIVTAGVAGLWKEANARKAKMRLQTVFLGLCAGYFFEAMFERYLINIGNPASLIFLLAILGPQIKEGTEPRNIDRSMSVFGSSTGRGKKAVRILSRRRSG
jgi:O-antigen ligase